MERAWSASSDFWTKSRSCQCIDVGVRELGEGMSYPDEEEKEAEETTDLLGDSETL
jgi:hypothetical protein